MLLLVEDPDGLGPESASRCLDAPLTSTRWQQRGQSMSWVAVVLYDALWCSVVLDGALRSSMVLYGALWSSMVLCVLWSSMVLCGPL